MLNFGGESGYHQWIPSDENLRAGLPCGIRKVNNPDSLNAPGYDRSIPEDSGGCGFIPESLLRELARGHGRSKAAVDKVTAIQVRVFGPRLGALKGVPLGQHST